MATQATERSSFDKWRDGLEKASGNPQWNAYDCEIKTSVGEFNRHLQGTAGYRQLDWRLIKAMSWVETGAGHPEWRTNPMQIGVPGDPGLGALLSAKEGGQLILPPGWQEKITLATARSMPTHNIRAAIGYLLMRIARFNHQSVSNKDEKMHEVAVKRGDSIAKIAKENGTTVEIIRALNPQALILKPDQRLRYRKGSVQRVIVDWRLIDVNQVARLYNGGGDARYAQKLAYTYNLIKLNKASTCE
jgi:hypothetical protein